MNNVHFSSADRGWETPADLVSLLKPVFKFDLDVCATRPNVCERFISPEQDGLKTPWIGEHCWLNPPYGREIGRWVDRAVNAALLARTAKSVTCLIPARTDTAWWQRNIESASTICFLRGRLCFGSEEYWAWRWSTPTIDGRPNALYGKEGRKQAAPFPSAIVVFSFPYYVQWRGALEPLGWTIELD